MKFVDEVRIKISSGRGGAGCVSYRRESYAPRGGPDGGDGGKGGDVIFRVNHHLNTLMDYRQNKKYKAANGAPGGGAKCSGHNGDDLMLEVPPGTLVKSEAGEILLDLTSQDSVYFLKGGRGGKGNHFFKTSVNQAPDYAQPGETGEEQLVVLELKLIADVGIIGFPNAGKSTLISRISAAKPKIADYPFTTLTPQLGVVKEGEYSTFVVADIPGLVKGAHQGVGLGIQFLKHIERTRLFVHLLDCSGMSGRDPLDDYKDINNELQMYDEANKGKEGFSPLTSRPQIVVLNKIDVINELELKKLIVTFKKKLKIDVLTISSVTGKNLKDLIVLIGRKLNELGPNPSKES